MAVKVKVQHTNVTDGNAHDVVDAPLAGKSRVIPPKGISVHNSHISATTTFQLIFLDGATERRIESAVVAGVVADGVFHNAAPIHLETTDQKVVIDNAVTGIDLDIVASFLEES